MAERRTPRQLAREATLERIKDLALEQLAAEGAAGLSLRAIARELNLVSSAIYRYYASRDDLVTDLIVDAYTDLAERISQAMLGEVPPAEAWVAGCLELRAWAVAQPHRYALVYGSAIPGYVAPPTTIEPAARVVRALAAPMVAHFQRSAGRVELPGDLVLQLDAAADGLDLPRHSVAMLSVVGAFARVQGLVGLELNGHFVGGFEPADVLFETLVRADVAGWRLDS